MKKRLISSLLAVIMCVSLLAVPADASGISGAKTTSALNLRSGASTSKSIIMTMPVGAEVIVGMTQNGWCKVVYNNTVGYASAEYLKAVGKVSGNFGTGTVSGDDVRMRSGAGTGSSIIGTYDKGTKMSVIGASGNWYEVSYNGKTGYVSADYMKLSVGNAASTPSTTHSPAPSASTATTSGGFKASVIGTSVRLRSQASTSSDTLGYYSNGVSLTALGSVKDWYKVSYNGKVGYMAAQYVRITPTDSYSSAKSGTVSGDSVRMRMGPSTDFAAIGTLSKGTSVKISGETGSWYEISANGKYGYMSKDYIKVVSTASTDTVEKMDKIGIVTGNGVRMRSGAGTSYSTIGYYDKGIHVKVTGKTGSWYAVSYNGLSGYMSTDYVKLSTGNTVANQIVATAKQYLGTPYVYGGSSPRGFDCSGFMYYLYGQYGYKLWRTASTQWANNGIKVEKSRLQPGDLVFFSDSVDPIGHVGMYIGDNQFIHASSGKGCVVITSLSASYYANHYTGAKRIIQ